MPTFAVLGGCWASAAHGHAAAAPPSSVMNWRRLIRSPVPRPFRIMREGFSYFAARTEV
jgi:hypothetical protein